MRQPFALHVLLTLCACGSGVRTPSPGSSSGGTSGGATSSGDITGPVYNTSGAPNTNTGGGSASTTGGSTGACTASAATATDQITISGFVITPSCMLVSRGAGGTATVTVTNNDGAAHDLVARAGGANSFATGNIAGGGGQHSFSVATVGSTDVFCSVHPSMAPITLIVQ